MEGLKGKVFYFDSVHPDGRTGHRWVRLPAQQRILAYDFFF
jgi:hypothetical protein